MREKKSDDTQEPSDMAATPATDYWNTDLAKEQQAFQCSHMRAMLALEAVKLNVISSEEAGSVVRAFIIPKAE